MKGGFFTKFTALAYGAPFVRFFRETMSWKFAFEINRPLDTPKKQTDEFVWFPVKSKKTD